VERKTDICFKDALRLDVTRFIAKIVMKNYTGIDFMSPIYA